MAVEKTSVVSKTTVLGAGLGRFSWLSLKLKLAHPDRRTQRAIGE